MSLVLYFFQGELGESIDSPNAFVIQSSGPITLSQFQSVFPVKRGNFHFRFQAEDKTYGYVWKDITVPTEILPSYMGNITVKVLKLDAAQCAKRKTKLRRRLNAEYSQSNDLASIQKTFSRNSNNFEQSSRTEARSSAASSSTSSNQTPSYSAPPPSKAQSSAQSSPAPPASKSVSNSNTPVNNAPPKKLPKNPSDSNISSPPSASTAPVNQTPQGNTASNVAAAVPSPTVTVTHNFFEDETDTTPATSFSTTPSFTAPARTSTSGGDIDIDESTPVISLNVTLNREQLAAQREKGVQDAVDAALNEKLKRDEKLREEEAALEVAKAKHDKNLIAWATNNNEKRNIRTLLSTMHTVTWPGCKWKPIGLGDVLAPNQVKLQYRKAMLVVHPDRCSGMDVETKFIAKRIFEGVNEAFTQFLEKEGGV